MKHDKVKDMYVGHDFPGFYSSGMGNFVLDEVELGARVTAYLNDPEQTWWALHELRKSVEGRQKVDH